MKKFFNTIERKNYIFLWEPRGDWNADEIRVICEGLNLIHCVDPFKNKSIYGNIKYYRLHGIKGYNYQYNEKDLNYFKKLIISEKNKYTYVMFNNTNMYKDALKLKKSLT